MFYSQIILAKKGPLGKVWQAAHWGDKKLGRPAIFATDISATVDTITNPAAPMALRVSGHLLLGVVRIYSRQVKYLIDDCQQAMVKVKMAYRLTTGAGGNKGAEAAIIDIEVNPAGARALNISNFGEYSELDFSHANFEIPFDITNETAEEDWVPAELHGQTLDFAPEQPTEHSDEDSFGAVGSGKKSGARRGVDAEEEEWGAFEPDDDEEEDENKSKDDSTVSEIEKTRAANNESMASDPNSSRRLSVLNQTGDSADRSGRVILNVGDNGSLSDQEFPAPDDDFMDTGGGGDDVMGMDDDYQQQPPNDSLRLELSNDDSNDNLGSGGAPPGISFGEEDEDEGMEMEGTKQSDKKKRKSAENQKANTKKKRKIVSEFGATELSSDHIRTMLADTSKVVKSVVHPATWVPGRKKKTTFGLTDRQLIRHHATIEKLLQRPCLADDGQLAPKLLEQWARNTAPIRGEPFAYKLRQDDKNEKNKDDEDSVEKARLADDNGSADEFPAAEDNDFPEADGGDNPFLDEEEGHNIVIPFDDSMEDQMEMHQGSGDDPMGDESPGMGSKGSMESVFSLDPTNALDEDFGDDDNEDRQTSEETTATWHKNTVRVFQVLKNKMMPSDNDSSAPVVDHVSYNELSHGVTRRTAAGVFFELLALKTLNFVELNQTEPFGDIDISPGVKFMEDHPSTKQ